MHTIRVWDLPTRLFHWALVLCIIGLTISGQWGGEALVWHFKLGYTTLTLLLFRCVWGFVGGRWSRFVHFVRGPRGILQYLRGSADAPSSVGHNPLGALSVLGLLLLILIQVLTGLISDDEIAASGPWVAHVSNAWVLQASKYHAHIGKWILGGLVGLHLLAIAFYQWKKRQPLVRAMLTGDKAVDQAAPESQDSLATRLLALALFVGCAALVAYAVT